ncbi:hypothetical protein E7744_10690 [Citricoccus sp. SGAir0253]|uniref:hypothetical protein n=1 Tax=Citricoccus sp. SGAir0253 TaxID=2567881 RepID=UPI0010CCFB11|nr:hypothetical protein [Citricoccus sp. SGAir0253]QCU78569.1 hypothetical protein E7744_10690 [Citricoccus sp. SGAir0253]
MTDPGPADPAGPEEGPGPEGPGEDQQGWARYHPAYLVLLSFMALSGVARLVVAIAGGLGWVAVGASALVVAMLVAGVVWQVRLMRREERRRRPPGR